MVATVNVDCQVQPRGCRGEDRGAEQSHNRLDSKSKEVLNFLAPHIILMKPQAVQSIQTSQSASAASGGRQGGFEGYWGVTRRRTWGESW